MYIHCGWTEVQLSIEFCATSRLDFSLLISTVGYSLQHWSIHSDSGDIFFSVRFLNEKKKDSSMVSLTFCYWLATLCPKCSQPVTCTSNGDSKRPCWTCQNMLNRHGPLVSPSGSPWGAMSLKLACMYPGKVLLSGCRRSTTLRCDNGWIKGEHLIF